MKRHLLSLLAITLMIATSIQAQIPTNGLVAYYPFSGNANDASGNGNNGTVNGATLTTDRFGKSNSAYSFDGITNSIAFPQTFIFNQSGDGTVSIWLKNDSILSQIYSTFICSKLSNSDLDRFNFYLQPLNSNQYISMTMDYRESNSKLHVLNTTNSIKNHSWNSIIVTRIGNSYSFYLNGLLANNITDSNANLPSQIGWLIGKNPFASSLNFKGTLDDIRLYNRALDNAEVNAIYHEGGYDTATSDIPKNGLVAWYPFTGNTLDSSGNGNNGTNNGATLATDRFGKANSAYSFNGVSNYISGLKPKFPTGNSSRSISQWINVPSKPSTGVSYAIFSWGNNTQTNNMVFGSLLWDANSQPWSIGSWVAGGKAGNDGIIPYNYSTNTWYHYVVTYNADTILYYMNGALIGSKITTQLGTVADQFVIGKAIANDSYLNGKIDDIRIYNRSLDSTEVKALYHEGGYNGTILPVSLSNFAASTNSNNIQLNWLTATELNTNHFIVQHSIDGISFTNVGSVNAIGNGANNYVFTDKTPISGTNYYRLQSVDKDGAISYSKVVSVQFTNGSNHFTVYPNPVRNTLTISGEHIAMIQVLDNMGRIVNTQSLQDATNPLIKVDMFTSGVYHLRIQTTDGKSSTVGFIKQ